MANLSNKILTELQNLCNENQIKWTGNLSRQGSDGRLAALLLKSIYPQFVDLNNYPKQNSTILKLSSWETLNLKVLNKIGLRQTKEALENLARGSPGYFETLVQIIMQQSPNNLTFYTHQGKILDEEGGIVIVNVDKAVDSRIVKVPQKMIKFSAYQDIVKAIKIMNEELERYNQKIAHYENLIKLIEEENLAAN